ncbi:hypothetical protein OK016_16795 [Vibrio chagasii]|nr:hypothetical protein [Vibrio chagasii]
MEMGIAYSPLLKQKEIATAYKTIPTGKATQAASHHHGQPAAVSNITESFK